MMSVIKKLFISFISIITVAGIMLSFFVLYPRRYNDNLHIDNISGDSSVLNDIKIKGVLSDGIQKTEFAYYNGLFNKKYTVVTDSSIRDYFYNKNISPVLPNVGLNKSYIIPEDADKQISHGINEDGRKVTKIATNKAVLVMDFGVLSINTDVIMRSNDYRIFQYETEGQSQMSPINIGIDTGIETDKLIPIETVDDKNYLYTTTGADCAGLGGIYEMKVINKTWTIIEENLAPLDLKDGDVQIIGMKASNDWFVFITVENEQVVLYPFNRQTSSFKNAIVLGELPENAKTEWDGYRRPIIREAFYNATIQGNQFFNIEVIDKPDDDYTYAKSCFYTADLNKNKKLISYSENTAFDSGQSGDRIFNAAVSETIMGYKNDRLYVLRSYWQRLFPIGSGMHTKRVNGLHISVYENNRDVYQGEIISAAEEDYRYQGPEMYKGYGTTYIRGYYYLGID